jgi:hypothetical protein
VVAGAAGAGCVAAASVGGGAAVVAGVPQAESSIEMSTSRLPSEYDADFLFISLSFIS